MKIGHKVPPHGGNGQTTWWDLLRIHHKDGVSTDRTGKPVCSVDQLFVSGMNLSKNFVAKFIVIMSVTVNAVYCHRRGV